MLRILKLTIAVTVPGFAILAYMAAVTLYGVSDGTLKYVLSVFLYFLVTTISGIFGSRIFGDKMVACLGFIPAINLLALYAFGLIWMSNVLGVDATKIFTD